MLKQVVLSVIVLVVAFYLGCVIACNVEHNKQLGIKGMNPCGSCWALNPGE